MSDIKYDCIPCPRPEDDELRTMQPQRPTAEALGWKVQLWYATDGTPSYERQTHGNYTDRWFKLVPAAS